MIRPYVTERLLVLERIGGEKVGPEHGLAAERAARARAGLLPAYIHQVTLEGVYHADPHRGNVLLTDDGRLALLDFGLLGRLDEERGRRSRRSCSPWRRTAPTTSPRSCSRSPLTNLDSDEPGFVHELRRKLPRYHWRPARGNPDRRGAGRPPADRPPPRMRLPTAFALVGKTLAQADSIARTLDPELDPVQLIEREAYNLVLTEAEAQLEPGRLFANLYAQIGTLTRLPRRVGQIADRLEAGTLKVGIVPASLDDTEHMLRSVANRVGAAIIVVGLLISSALMARVNHAVSLAGFCLSAVIGLYMIWKILRTPGDL